MHQVDPTREKELSELQPASQTRINAILNGMLNGITIGSAGIGFLSLRRVFTGKHIPDIALKISAAASVIGGVLGTLWGIRDSEHTNTYRDAINQRIDSLQGQVNEIKQAGSGQYAVSEPEAEGTVTRSAGIAKGPQV